MSQKAMVAAGSSGSPSNSPATGFRASGASHGVGQANPSFPWPGVSDLMTRTLLLCVMLTLSLANALSVHAETLTLSPEQTLLRLGTHAEYLEDPQGAFSIDAVAAQASGWQASTKQVLNFGYTASTYWIRLGLSLEPQEQARALAYVLELAYPVLDHVDAYVFRQGVQTAHYQMGDKLPFAQRPIDHPNFAIPLKLDADAVTEVYLRVQSSSSIQVPLNLYRNQALVEASYQTAITQTLFYGALLIMALYNLLLFMTLREISYLYFVLMVLSTSTLMAGIEGLTFKYVWPQLPASNDPILVVALAGIVTFSALFFRSFLDR